MKKKFRYSQHFFEKQAWLKEKFVCGIDEAGRGALAGPVVAAAAILPLHTQQNFLRDSKQMSKKQRDEAYEWIIQNCWYATGIISHQMVDKINIYQATKRAMTTAYTQTIEQFSHPLDKLNYIVVDAVSLSFHPHYLHKDLEVHHFNYGESISRSIAAASIVAKVTRDRLMNAMHTSFPAYHFEKHKGYGTTKHKDALVKHGKSIVHRSSFLTSLDKKAKEHGHQQCLF